MLGPVLVFRSGGADAPTGLLNAVAYDPLPAQLSVNVRPLNDSDENLALKQAFETALRERGYTVAVDAPLVLTFETREAAGAWADRGRRTVIELEARGEGVGGDQQRVRLNLFNSSSGGVFNRGREGGTGIVTPSHFRIDLSIDDRSSGERLWQAWAVADIGRSAGLASHGPGHDFAPGRDGSPGANGPLLDRGSRFPVAGTGIGRRPSNVPALRP